MCNQCLNCGKPVKNKYCNVSCQNKHKNPTKINKKLGDNTVFIVKCHNCNKEFEIIEREHQHPKKEKYYCSRSCANSRKHSDTTKKRISVSMNNYFIENNKESKHIHQCVYCHIDFISKKKTQQFCSRSCSTKHMNKTNNAGHKGGMKSCQIQKETRRSKNEKYFSDLCKLKFKNVVTNEPIFNCWDADIILLDHKVAVLWNGKWHYEKITQKHSVKQVQNRDKIKIKEIISAGFYPYIIKDMGKHNTKFVIEEFNKFVNYLVDHSIISDNHNIEID